MFDHETYLSPLTWRYGGEEMRRLWSEANKRRLLRRFWVALAGAQQEAGLVSAAQVDDLRAHQDDIDIAAAEAIEREIRHDLMAEIKTYAAQCPVGGAIIHLGATSMDVLDNVDALRLRGALDLIIAVLEQALYALADRIEAEAHTATIAFTHIQPAEPTTIGYRLAQYGQDLLIDLAELRRVRAGVRGKGLKGAVGASASYTQLLEGVGWTARQLEERVMVKLGLEAFPVATQTYTRKQDWLVLNALAGLCASLHKFAFDLRVLQSPPFGEWSEPFGAKQVGSSAMPFKRNPIVAENIDSLTRLVAALPRVAWDNAALSLLERTLDDSANRRLLLPEAFLLTDEVMSRALRLIEGMRFWRGPIQRNLRDYGVFAATERVLMAGVQAGGDRQELHEVIREQSLAAWAALQEGKPNPLADLLANDARITRFVPAETLPALLDATGHVGDAAERALALAAEIRRTVAQANSA
ncbi:MAG: adenylosuccinate lyase [Chloroflexota bacterium]|nr:adenylosuccinate lyase [Caldilinea sp.]GIK72976.1 MAG: adenylosuccinate lyase [Chloroflexota bacterium]